MQRLQRREGGEAAWSSGEMDHSPCPNRSDTRTRQANPRSRLSLQALPATQIAWAGVLSPDRLLPDQRLFVFGDRLADLFERAPDQAGDVHLRDPHLLRDLR